MRSVGLIFGLQDINLLGSRDVADFLDNLDAETRMDTSTCGRNEARKDCKCGRRARVRGWGLKDALAWVRLNQG